MAFSTSSPSRVDRSRSGAWSDPRRNLAGACLAHVLHDGYTDQLYALLPLWQSQFGLHYAGLAVVRALYYGTMGGLQIPADNYAARVSPRAALALATVVAAGGYLVMALPFGFTCLCAGLVLAGVGSSVQHPRASFLVTTSFGDASREPLGLYNFAGDLGKATFPAVVALLVPFVPWRPIVGAMALVGAATAMALLAIMPDRPVVAPARTKRLAADRTGRGFGLLVIIGAFDTATRMGYLLFLPFLIRAGGGREASVGLGLALLFSGGALGKACCGLLGQRLGVTWSVVATEATTALLMLATLVLPLGPVLAILPMLGVVLNGTSSVLYGTVPELARDGEVGRAFARFYTGVIGAGGLAPIAYGVIADHAGRTIGVEAAALTAAAIVPMVFALRPHLREEARRRLQTGDRDMKGSRHDH